MSTCRYSITRRLIRQRDERAEELAQILLHTTRDLTFFDSTKRDVEGMPVMAGLGLSKLGQWPAQSIDPPKKAKLLGKQTEEFYKKGLTSFQHGFGLGALAYFRRVVEDAAPSLPI